jgi:hypothetical protein
MISDLLVSGKPFMVARFGSTELNLIANYIGVSSGRRPVWNLIRGRAPEWWWCQNMIEQVRLYSGFFPLEKEAVVRFCQLMLEDAQQLDILGSWLYKETFVSQLPGNVAKIKLPYLEPYLCANPWTRCLKGRKVLVVHPFAKLIEQQYRKRALLFKNPDVLPDFQLKTVPAVQSLGGMTDDFSNWFDALHWMEEEIDKVDYEVCLIGCGAYGLPLAAHVKRRGRQAIHLGGVLQLLFGIRGKRWEDPKYALSWGIGLPERLYLDLFNEHWVKPSEEFKPEVAGKVENGCYW